MLNTNGQRRWALTTSFLTLALEFGRILTIVCEWRANVVAISNHQRR